MLRTDIKAVFIDAGDTLFTERVDRADTYRAIARDHGVPELERVQVSTAMQRALEELPETVDGHFRYSSNWFHSFNRHVMSECGVAEDRLEAANEQLLEHFRDPANYRLYEEVPEVLAELAEHGKQVGVLSNWSEHLTTLLEGLGIADSISFVIASADLKAEKPGRAIFERALFRAGAAAGETVHVGDHFDRDVQGALAAGLRAVWLNREQDESVDREGVPVIEDLRGLLRLLEAQPSPAPN